MSHLLSSAFTLSYLSSIYVLPPLFALFPYPSRVRQPDSTGSLQRGPAARNDPRAIKNRLAAVSLTTLLSLACLPLLVDIPRPELVRHLGFGLPGSAGGLFKLVVAPLGLTMSLFSGSLVIAALDKTLPGQAGNSLSNVGRSFGSWPGLRNYLVVSTCPRLACFGAVAYVVQGARGAM